MVRKFVKLRPKKALAIFQILYEEKRKLTPLD